jgi:hypothetical protein
MFVTGALSSTSATFSGNVTALDAIINNGANSTSGIKVISSLSGSLYTGGIEFIRTSVAAGSKIEPFRDAGVGGVGFKFLTTADNAAEVSATYTSALTILNTGAATFASSIQIQSSNGIKLNRSANDYYWQINSDSSNYLNFGAYLANGTAYGTNPKMIIQDNGNVGIGTSSPLAPLDITSSSVGGVAANLVIRNSAGGSASGNQGAGLYFLGDGGFTVSNNSASIIALTNTRSQTNGGSDLFFATHNNSTGPTTKMVITAQGNVGIGTSSPNANGFSTALTINGTTNSGLELSVGGTNQGYLFSSSSIMGLVARTNIPLLFYTNDTERMRITSAGNVGIGRTPLSKLAVYGGPVQIMQDYPGHQIIIRSSGNVGTYSGQLTITIPEMSDAGSSQGYGGYSCEVYVAGFNGMYCHAWFSGYVNNGLTASEATILRSNGGWSISQTATGTFAQGFIFYIDYPDSITHPTARIIFNKGGDPNRAEYPANQITAVWS